MKTFKKICRKNQLELKAWLYKLLKMKYRKVVCEDGFLYAKGDVPILLTAHMDTVHKETCKQIVVEKKDGKTIFSSPQGIGGDDRCGVWMIWMILCKTKYRPSVLFCEDEEIGGVGSNKFTKTDYVKDLSELKYMIELDRANDKDAVYYDCGNEDFMDYIKETTGYTEAYGSFSDISHLSPASDVASVNLSCGYYNAHTLSEYVVYEEMFATYKVVKDLLSKAKDCKAYDYQEYRLYKNYASYDYDYGYGYKYNLWDYTNRYNQEEKAKTEIYEINFMEKGEEMYDWVDATSLEEALGIIFMNYPTVCYNDIIDWGIVRDEEAV